MKEWEIKEFDVLSIQREASLMAAKKLNVDNYYLMDNIELSVAIGSQDQNIYKALINFTDSYWSLLFYCKGISSSGRRTELSSIEKDKVDKHIADKNQSKHLFLEALNKYSFESSDSD
jgi:hypothetical protein